MKKSIVMILAASLLAIGTAALAANKAETFSISPVLGGITFEGKQHLETSPVFGVRAGYNFTKALGVEALFDYANSKGTLTGRDVDFYRYGGELLYHFMPDNKLVPYLAAGFAAVNFKGDTATDSANTPRGAFDYGAGLKYFLTDNLALRGDIRHLIYKHDQTHQAVEYTLGAYIPFGGAAPAVKPVEPPPAPAPVVAPPPPAPAPPVDSDGDGVPDTADKCPGTPRGVVVDASGCPLDSDGDGVPDYLDKCPDTPKGTAVDKDGCPPPAPKASVAAEKFCSKPAVLDIQFDTDKADIKSSYFGSLKTVGEFLKEFPRAKGEISGHTDNVGSKPYNQKLSERRAENTRKYLVDTFGIAPERIDAKGYGYSKPVASNKTEDGKARNRRIEANFTCE